MKRGLFLPKSFRGKGLIDLLPAGLRSKVLAQLMPLVVGTGGGRVYNRTLLTAQKYVVNWKDLESAFPQLLELPKYSQKWGLLNDQMGEQGCKDRAMWDFVNHFRSMDGEARRMVRDKLVTTAFVDFIVDQLQTESSEFGDFKFHQCGLGVTAENITDTAIETDTGISPVTGTQTETDHDTYKSVATMTMDATEAITEHVLMSQSGAGTCMDRTLFSAINVVSGNQIGNGLPLGRLNGQYGVNCGNAKGNAYANPQPSRVNDIKVTRKVQRLEVEESTNKTSDSAPHPVMDEEIVQAKRKLLDKLASSHLKSASLLVGKLTFEPTFCFAS